MSEYAQCSIKTVSWRHREHKELVLSIKGSFVDGNTWYGGLRAHTAAHLQAAKDHGFTYAPVDILDSQGEIRLPILGGPYVIFGLY